MSDYNDEKVLKYYTATSGYTIRALEGNITELKKKTSRTKDLIPIYQERLE